MKYGTYKSKTLRILTLAGLSFTLLPAFSSAETLGRDLFAAMQVHHFALPPEAPEFTLPDLDQKPLRLADYHDKLIVLNFWATWCPACREEMPSMERLYREFKDRGAVVLAVNLQEAKETVAAYVQSANLTFPVLLDEHGKVSERYEIRFIPTTFIVDRTGKMVGKVVGPKDWASLTAYEFVGSLLEPARSETLISTAPQSASAGSADIVRTFLERHWQFPIPPQGPAAAFTPLEASLEPASCGTCHPAQYADWQISLHAKSMGPGVMGQLLDMMRSDPLSALDCQRCHSPLAEQQPKRRVYAAQGQPKLIANPAFDPALQARGLVCAACHVRAWERFGPPKRDGNLVANTSRETLPHRGATRTPAFLKSEFCMGCHQFPPNGFALNGKLLENTYEEWRASTYARDGVQCQDCHMPDRRHLWRGIHDADMVRRGVTIDLQTERQGTDVEATLTVTNSGVGHYFPTYLTPKVFLNMQLVDAAGQPVKNSFRQTVIGREVPLDLSREIFDTRLPPLAGFRMKESWNAVPAGLRLRVRVIVEPDHFYTRFFQSTIAHAELGRAQLEEALRQTQRSSFTIYAREVSL